MQLSRQLLEFIVTLAELDTPKATMKLVKYVEALSDEQKAELVSMMWAGRDGGEYEEHVVSARKMVDDQVGFYMAEQGFSLGEYLRKGMAGRYR